MDWSLVAIMVGIHAMMFLTPGPDSIIVVSRATAQGMKHAFAASLGVVSAGVILVPGIAFGMDFINTLSPAVWMLVRAAGAAYLIYVGAKILVATIRDRRARDQTGVSSEIARDEPLFAAYVQGLLTNLGNPKMIVLLTSFLPQFVAVEMGNVSVQILILGAIMYTNGLICFSILALSAIALKRQVVRRWGSQNLSFAGGNVAGTTMVGLGVWMLIAPVQYLLSGRAK